MPWDGSGNFGRTNGVNSGTDVWTQDAAEPVDILAGRHDVHDEDLADGIQACLTKDGQTKATADFRPNSDGSLSLGSAALRWLNAWIYSAIKFKQTFTGTLQAATLTADRTWTLPDADLSLFLPTGAIWAWGGADAPSWGLLCYGQVVSRTTYARLFAAIGTTFGAGDGSTTFTLPDARGRALFGLDNMGGTPANRITFGVSGIVGDSLGVAGGSQNMHAHSHTGTTSSNGSHDHDIQSGTTTGGQQSLTGTGNAGANSTAIDLAGDHTHTFTSSTAGTGSSQNMPPALIVNCVIVI